MDIITEILELEEKEKASVKKDGELLKLVADFIINHPYGFNNLKYLLKSERGYNPNGWYYLLLEELPKISSYAIINGEEIDERDVLFDKLKEYGFNENNEIKMAIRTICKSSEFTSYDAYKLENSYHTGYKTIKKIEINYMEGSYIIWNDLGEAYKFYKADVYFSDNEELLDYIKKHVRKNNCHEYAEHLQTIFPDGETITSHCPRFMGDNYYTHSYVELNGMIIDLNLNVVMDKETYYKLMRPTELVRIKNSDVEKYREFINGLLAASPNSELLENYYFLLILAEASIALRKYPDLYQEFLNLSDSPKRS